MRKCTLLLIATMLILPTQLTAQTTEGYITNNLGRIVEVATPNGVLPGPHVLIGWDSNGFVKQANSTNQYKLFGNSPSRTNLNGSFGFNNNNFFGRPSGYDAIEIRFGFDSSYCWDESLSLIKVPFSIYNVGPRSPNDTAITGGTKLCFRKRYDKIHIYGDFALPLDSTYNEFGASQTFPYNINRPYITELLIGNPGVGYEQNMYLFGFIMPDAGTVIRFIPRSVDSNVLFIDVPDIIQNTGTYHYSMTYYSFEKPQYSLINAPPRMTVDTNGIITWTTYNHQSDNSYHVLLRYKNRYGDFLRTLTAKARNPIPDVIPLYEISSDSIFDVMLQLQSFGTRDAGAPNNRDVTEWIKNKFISYGYTSAYLDASYNVLATLPGYLSPDSVYIVGAHHDSRSWDGLLAPGADDNASGTSAVLEIARVFKKTGYQPMSTVKFITFNAEEYNLAGSRYFARVARDSNMRIQMMINNDMIATCQDSSLHWRVNILTYPKSSMVTDLALEAIKNYSTLGADTHTVYLGSDSWSFYEQGYKTIFFHEDQFSPFYHSPNDSVSNCNIQYLKEMVKISYAMLIMENGNLFAIDTISPVLSLHALSTQAVNRVRFMIGASEPLMQTILRTTTDTLKLSPVKNGYAADYNISKTGSVNLTLTGKDIAGNVSTITKTYQVTSLNKPAVHEKYTFHPDGQGYLLMSKAEASSIPDKCMMIGEPVEWIATQNNESMKVEFAYRNSDLEKIQNRYEEVDVMNLGLYSWDGEQWEPVETSLSTNKLSGMAKGSVMAVFYNPESTNTPKRFALEPNYPNPFNPSTTIRYQLAENSKVTLKIYNLLGQEVRTLVNANQPSGIHSVVWDGKNNHGQRVTSGVYFYRLQAGDFVKTRKMVLVK